MFRFFAATLLMCCLAIATARAEEKQVEFAREVRPILESSCWKCHGPEKQKGGLRLDRREGGMRPADSGKKAVVPGKTDESELIRRVESADASERMPAEAEPLSREQIAFLRN